eukprot:359173_1
MGMAQALGVRFLDADGQALAANGGNLARVASIEMDECDPRLANCHIEVACDVDNPLAATLGFAGANLAWQTVFWVGGVVPLILVPLLMRWLPESAVFAGEKQA